MNFRYNSLRDGKKSILFLNSAHYATYKNTCPKLLTFLWMHPNEQCRFYCFVELANNNTANAIYRKLKTAFPTKSISYSVVKKQCRKTSHEVGVLEHRTQTKMSVKYGKCWVTTPDIQYAVFQLLQASVMTVFLLFYTILA